MFFLLRAMFWTAAVILFVPEASHGTIPAVGLQTLEQLKADAILTLARVRLELNERGVRAR